MIKRVLLENELRTALKRSPIVLLSGPRQCGKTTLAREIVDVTSVNYLDCEDPVTLARLSEPMTALSALRGFVVIDEVQRRPDLFPVLRVLADRPNNPARFLILGSASGELLRQSSESLAGRLEVLTMQGFIPGEVDAEALPTLWRRGGFPRSLLAASDDDSYAWRSQFIATLVERDIPSWGVRISPTALTRFWHMLAHYHGQTWNASEMARAMGLSQPTVRHYLDIMTDAFMVRQLQPFHANTLKRQVKAPKIFIRDAGLLHTLLGYRSERDIYMSPKIGASWEGWIIESIIASVRPDAVWFWATHAGAEIDLVMVANGRRIGVECKRSDAPRITPSMVTARTELQLDELFVVYPGPLTYPLADHIQALSIRTLASQPDYLVCSQ
ncbi:MAG: ATP-binding protein [Candidatus Kapabacteria bacterium]|nr:ATP-binding protein [Candidatus Kapabacteria bacterium]